MQNSHISVQFTVLLYGSHSVDPIQTCEHARKGDSKTTVFICTIGKDVTQQSLYR